MTSKITRRRALAGLSSTLMLPILGAAQGDARLSASWFFQHGVASGDPDHESLVIWTRVSGYERPVSV
ncbi:MAG: PhoD-like phosphatase N-terminal domain-containing protein, partial [Congregibacter sp.]|nr:PhoD-like phosphatase N-terminal domain-containing protein [Congregibacter sp.]